MGRKQDNFDKRSSDGLRARVNLCGARLIKDVEKEIVANGCVRSARIHGQS
jgi:hypothetical protein